MRARPILLMLTFAILPACFASAQYPVYFHHSGEDSIGQRIAYNVEKEIRGSSLFQVADTTLPHWSVYLVTLEISEYTSAYSLVFTACPVLSPDRSQEFYITQIVGYCGLEKVASCVEGISASMIKNFKDYVNDGSLTGMAKIMQAVEAGQEFKDFRDSIPQDELLLEASESIRR